MSEELVMKLTKIAIGVSLGLGGLAVNASDVAMFPYIVSSSSVTTIVTVVDRGGPDTQRYNASGVPSVGGNRLHWRLNYKTGNPPGNSAGCTEVDYFLPTSANDIQSVDISGQLTGTDNTRGVLFNDPSINNNWQSALEGSSLTYALASQVSGGQPLRGVLFVHNGDETTGNFTVQGEAMVYEFANGAAWGYSAMMNDGGEKDSSDSDFDFNWSRSGQYGYPGVTFMPRAEANTLLFITPVNAAGESMLATGGGNIAGWNNLAATVLLESSAGGAAGVAFDRDENLVSGSIGSTVKCVGAVNVQNLMTSGARTVLQDGGYGFLRINGNAIVQKLEYAGALSGLSGTLNGQDVAGASNNAFILP
jgi:hypothetical protein